MKYFQLNKVNDWTNISFRTQKRKEARNEFEKDFYKLLNSLFYGKTMEDMQDKDMILLLENIVCGGISSIMSDRYVNSDENKKIFYFDANILYGHSKSQSLPYDEIKFDKNVELEDVLKTPDDSDIGYFVEADLIYPDNIKEKTKNFPFAPVNKKIIPDNFSDYMKEIKPDTYIQTSKLIYDW